MENNSATTARKKSGVYSLTLISLMAAVICVLSPLSVPLPFTPVPISLASLAIYFVVMLLGMKKGTISTLIYLLIGLVGVPVFAGFSGGAAVIAGPTGGYLVGYIFLALIAGWFVDKFEGKIPMYFVGMVLGTIVLYALGTAWLAHAAGMGFKAALFAGVIPYIPGDTAKMIIAVFAGETIRKRLKKANLI